MSSLASRYADLVPAPVDPALEQIVRDLDRAYGAENPNVGPPPEWRAQLGTALAHRAAETTPRRVRLHWSPIHSWRQAGLAVVLTIVVLGGGILGLALTDNPRYNQQTSPNVPVFAQPLFRFGHPINQAATACGYTVEVTQAYADANQTIVAMVISAPPGRDFVALTGTGSLTLRAVTAKAPAGASSPRLQSLNWWAGSMFHNTESIYAAFDTHQLAHGTAPLHLRITLSGFVMIEELHNARPLPANWNMPSCERYSSTPWFRSPANASLPDRARAFLSTVAPGLIPSPIGRSVNIDRGYSMSFTVPMNSFRAEIEPNQAVTAAGVTLILDQVTATHSDIRVYLRRPKVGRILYYAQVSMSGPLGGAGGGGARPLFADTWTRSAPATRRYDFSFPSGPASPDGRYTLTVQPEVGDFVVQPWLVLTGGPWVFHFTLP